LPGGETAVYNGSGLNYIRHTDWPGSPATGLRRWSGWLGSSRLATTWAHTVYSKEAYAPFGESYNEAGAPDRSFTVHISFAFPSQNPRESANPPSSQRIIIIIMEIAMVKLKVTTFGSSTGIVLPKEVLTRLKVVKGDSIFLTDSPDGFRITPYDPDFERQMGLARKVMRERRDVLRELAK